MPSPPDMPRGADRNLRLTPVVVIGAGPAGLAVARRLKQRGVESLLLEKGDDAGCSWKGMPLGLKLITRWSLNELPDTPREIRPRETFVGAARFARYLEDYRAFHGLAVAPKTEATGVAADGDGVLRVTLADGRAIRAAEVVNATGYFGNPFVPVIAGAAGSTIPQLHFAQYRSPGRLAALLGGTGKRVLIVGKRISAGQAMLELASAGFDVSLSIRGPLKFGIPPSWRGVVQPFLPIVEWMACLRGCRRLSPPIRMPGGEARRLVESGRVKLRGGVERIEDRGVVFDDGSGARFDLLLYCTGFRPSLAHLRALRLADDTGLPKTERMESLEMPGLHFIGLDGQRDMRSRFLRGIRADAVVLADRIASRLSKSNR